MVDKMRRISCILLTNYLYFWNFKLLYARQSCLLRFLFMMALSSFIMGQFDPLEILGLLSEEVLFNFSLPSVLENTALFYYHSVRLYFCSRQS